ncbi:unnamed protein product [Effrenium voratum]|uniref:Trafficking protein particle complex subunit n=1 Tax=Effrenium voratum TaxID=2562239 RepID=A0AA36JST5_9DINO|nr:unnamed protein product [Effrenium voratum]CAJ1434539.1 unnamed protein product [Effrenium voratum]
MVVVSLFVLNRNGSLIYSYETQGSHLSSNDKIRLSSTFHGISAIAAQISPKRSGGSFSSLQGIRTLDADTFRLQCFHTATGVKIFCVLLPPYVDADLLLRQVYAHYSDFVLKNPFYELDMPIRFETFEKEVQRKRKAPLI